MALSRFCCYWNNLYRTGMNHETWTMRCDRDFSWFGFDEHQSLGIWNFCGNDDLCLAGGLQVESSGRFLWIGRGHWQETKVQGGGNSEKSRKLSLNGEPCCLMCKGVLWGRSTTTPRIVADDFHVDLSAETTTIGVAGYRSRQLLLLQLEAAT